MDGHAEMKREDDMLLAGAGENAKRFTKLIEKSFAGVALLNKELCIMCRSLSAQRITGWPDNDKVNRGLRELIHPDDKKQAIETLEQLLAEPGASKTLEYRALHFDGHYIWLESIFTNYLDDPEIQAIVLNFRDISERKQTENILDTRIQLTQTISDHLPVMVSYWSADLHCLFANKPYMDWVGCKPEEIIGLDKKEMLEGSEYAECESQIAAVLRGEPQSFERTLVKANGQIEYTHTNYWPDKEGGKLRGFYSLIYNITEIKTAQAAIERNLIAIENALVTQHAILNALPPSICLLDETGGIVEVNLSWMAFANNNELSMPNCGVGSNYIEISEKATGIDEETGHRVAEAIRKIISGAIGIFSMEYPCNSPTERRWFQVIISPFKSAAKRGAVVAHIDITERKEAELELAEREEQYRRIVETAQEGIWVMDELLRTTFVNKKMCDMLEYPMEEIIGRYNYEFKASPEVEKTIERLKLRREGIDGTHETSFITKNGRQITCLVSPTGIFDKENNFTGTLAMITDITWRKKDEEELKRSKANVMAIIENTDDLLYSVDRQFNLITFNSQFKTTMTNVFGFDIKEGQNVVEIGSKIDKHSAKKLERVFKRSIKGVSQHFTDEYIHGGLKHYVNRSINPIIESEEVIGLSCVSRNVTGQKLEELALIKSETNLRKVFDNTELAIILYDADFKILSYNKNASDYISKLVKKNLAEGSGGLDYFPAERIETVKSFIAQAKKRVQVSYDVLLEIDKCDSVWLEATWEGIWDAKKKYVGIVLTFKDITERKNTELELKKLSEDLLKRNEELKLLESVVTKSTDGLIIADTGNNESHAPGILYVNNAFTKMLGYEAGEVIGRTPDFLLGPKTDMTEMQKLYAALAKKESYETTIIKYKKNRDECFINVSAFPLLNEQKNATHWIALMRDVTNRKHREMQRALLTEIGEIFNEHQALSDCLHGVLEKIVSYGNFCMAEIWLVDRDEKFISRVARMAVSESAKKFANNSELRKSLRHGEGLPGNTWASGEVSFWNFDEDIEYKRIREARKAGFKRAYAIPFFDNKRVIGCLTFALDKNELPELGLSNLFEEFSVKIGAEIRRKQLEDELNQIFNLSPDIICIGSRDGYLKKVNPVASEMMAVTDLELLSRPILDFVHPDDREATSTQLKKVAMGQPLIYFENRCITGSGTIKWIAWTSSIASEEGLFFAVGKDITEKKALEELLTKATRLTRLGAWEFYVGSDTIHWSDITREIHEAPPGYQPSIEEAINFYQEGETRQMIVKTMKTALQNGTPGDVELQIVTSKGNTLWVKVIVEAEFKNDKCVRLYGSIQDVDARKKAELAANRSLEEKNTILESIDDAFFTMDKNWVITYWNKMAEQISGHSKDNMLGHNIWDIYPELKGSDYEKAYQKAIATQKAVRTEAFYPEVNRWNELNIYPSDTGLSVYFKVINDRKQTELHLKELNESLSERTKALELSNSELEQFAYVASHDLQEPLRMVSSFLTQLERKYGTALDDKARQYIFFAVDGAKRMRQIILDLLEFSRVNRREDELEEVDLNIIVNEVCALYRRRIEELKGTIEFGILPSILSYRTPLKQILQNLISNSLKYHEEGRAPHIQITSIETTPGMFEIVVSDNGIGIDSAYFDKIFILFQRLHNKDEYPGTGIGLAIVKKIIENLGGKIWVESEEGVGTKIHFTLTSQSK